MLKKTSVVLGGVLLLIGLVLAITAPRPIPEASAWMRKQLQKDFAYFENRSISRNKIEQLANNKEFERHLFVKYSIRNNKVEAKRNFSERIKTASIIHKTLEELCKAYSLPDMDFLVTMHDVLYEEFDVPVFSMAKHRNNKTQILIPDYSALRGRYQVLENRDITKYAVPWEEKSSRLFWRGSTTQHPLPGTFPKDLDDIQSYTRVKLCDLSLKNPETVDAKFTKFTQGGEKVPSLQRYRGDFVSYEDQLKFKYLMVIDGNSCSFSASGWRWFTNSLVIKDDSDLIQWYYNELKPGVHYISVRADLEDLLEKVAWAKEHDSEAKAIAKEAREFAISHITKEQNMIYLLHALLEYSKLNFVDDRDRGN